MAQIGSIKLQTGSGVVTLPVFELGDLDIAALRVQTASGVGAIPLLAVNEATYDYLRIQGSSLFGLHDAATGGVVIDDFEDGDIAEYTATTGDDFSVVSSPVFEGSFSLRNVVDGDSETLTSESGLDEYPSQGDSFEARIRTEGLSGSGNPGFEFGANGNLRYSVRPRSGDGTIKLYYIDLGSEADELASTSASIPDNEWMKVAVDWGTDGSIQAEVFDSSGTSLGQVSATDNRLSSGGVAWHSAAFSAATGDVFFDIAKITSRTTAGTGVIDDFEDNDMSEYTLYDSGNISTNGDAAFNGDFGLDLAIPSNSSGSPDAYSTSGLPNYPQAGNSFEYYVQITSRPDVGDLGSAEFAWCTQDTSNGADGFYIDLRIDDGPEDSFSIRKVEGGSESILSSSSQTLSFGTWYRVEVDHSPSGEIDARIYDGGSLVTSVSQTDATYSSGGVGFNFGTSGDGEGSESYFDSAEITGSVSGTTGVVDDFEDGDLSEYSIGAGAEGQNPNISTNQVFEGTYSVRCRESSLTSSSGLDRYPVRGDTFQTRVYIVETTDTVHDIFFAYKTDGTEGYFVSLRNFDNEIRLQDADGNATLASVNAAPPSGEWLRVEVDFQETITVTVYRADGSEYVSLSASDSKWDSGAVQLRNYQGRGSGNADTYFDLFEITST